MLKDRADIVPEIIAITAMSIVGSMVLGRLLKTNTAARIASTPYVGWIVPALVAARKEAFD